MKLYQHPVSTTCRPVMMFIADEGLDVEQEVVDILSGAHYGEEFTKTNPNNLVPVLEDGDFRLTESSAILKYLAEKCGSAAYPSDPQARAKVNEIMDWFNTGFYRAFAYGMVYPQLLDHCKLPNDTALEAQIATGKTQAERFLGILNDHILGDGGPWLCGETMTIADYFASGVISLGEVVGCKLSAYPNVRAWYDRMQSLPNWQAANGGVYQWAEMAQGPDYVSI
ncbi:MAG: glutathione S-transferase family protein [Alphaproteobacteria bacterium]|nr:glutathione S-transferase family protein [Alphaproteobacteria bacterium]